MLSRRQLQALLDCGPGENNWVTMALVTLNDCGVELHEYLVVRFDEVKSESL